MAHKLAQNDRMTKRELSPHSSDPSSPAAARAWDEFVASQPRAHLLQLSAWGALKAGFGWRARIVTLRDRQGIQAGALVLLKALPMAAGKLAYVPMGAYAKDACEYRALWSAIRSETGAAFLKLEPGHFPAGEAPDLAGMGFRESAQTIQPARTIVLDISGDDETILRRMTQGARRKVRKSQRGPVIYKEAERADLPAFNRLMQETGARNNFGVHNAAYFAALYDLMMPKRGALLMAWLGDELLAAIMVFALGDMAWYLYGASSRGMGNLYASYGIQWRAIQWAKSRGCRQYDLWGVPDEDEASLEAGFQTRKDGLWGVYGFKRGWGGQLKRGMGAWDLAWNPLVYAAYRGALRLRR